MFTTNKNNVNDPNHNSEINVTRWQQLMNLLRIMVKLYNYENTILHSPDHSTSLFL